MIFSIDACSNRLKKMNSRRLQRFYNGLGFGEVILLQLCILVAFSQDICYCFPSYFAYFPVNTLFLT